MHEHSTENVKKMKLSRRKCVVPTDEPKDIRDKFNKDITILEKYSQGNCLQQCRAELVMKACGCVPFFWPYAGEEFKNKSCDKDGYICLAKSSGKILEAIFAKE